MEKILKGNWIWTQDWNNDDEVVPRIVYFKNNLKVNKGLKSAKVEITADSRYKLYINNNFVEAGPLKGDNKVWYLDEMEISKYLHEGVNVIAVSVLRYPLTSKRGNFSVWRTEIKGLSFTCALEYKDDIEYINSDKNWKSICNRRVDICQELNENESLYFYEKYNSNILNEWKNDQYEGWYSSFEYGNILKNTSPVCLSKRNIPFMKRTQKNFNNISKFILTEQEENWADFVHNNKPIKIKANTKEKLHISAGELMCGYIKLITSGGKGTRIKILQSESYAYDPEKNPMYLNNNITLPAKGDRTDSTNGKLFGYRDEIIINGHEHEIFEPYWFRTFRFIELEIETHNEEMELISFNYEETGYPLNVITNIETSDNTLSDIWDISLRTLQRCMHETYMDCPFYEQLQYSMDSRNQILYTYAISGDDRLAIKCMDDFRRSQREDGMINCCYPCYRPNVIPSFGIYYIGMVYDHMMYFGDKDLIKKHLSAIDGVLNFFDRNLNDKNIVSLVGGSNFDDFYWSFIDWTKEWDSTTGVPKSVLTENITVESLLYVMGLQYASELCKYIGKNARASEYIERAEEVQRAILKFSVDSEGVIKDGCCSNTYSQHAQVFAILTDTISIDKGCEILKKTITDNKFVKCSVATMFYLFRALEKCGLYSYTNEIWDIWRNMLEMNLTTCVEDGLGGRSDCHAWGALILYELPSSIIGVKPLNGGIIIDPKSDYLDWAKGVVATPKGKVSVSWEKINNKVKLEAIVPKGMEVLIRGCCEANIREH
ncbi:MAG: alpha-L-rhamnosidase C-terminal domain-containing protein [Lachnospirales bacterium]